MKGLNGIQINSTGKGYVQLKGFGISKEGVLEVDVIVLPKAPKYRPGKSILTLFTKD